MSRFVWSFADQPRASLHGREYRDVILQIILGRPIGLPGSHAAKMSNDLHGLSARAAAVDRFEFNGVVDALVGSDEDFEAGTRGRTSRTNASGMVARQHRPRAYGFGTKRQLWGN